VHGERIRLRHAAERTEVARVDGRFNGGEVGLCGRWPGGIERAGGGGVGDY